jgi:S1-C subfamily serine protease
VPGRLTGAVLAVCAAAALALGACGDDSSGETSTAASQTSTTTVVEGAAGEGDAQRAAVIESAGGPFDSQAIYSKAAPGVVTVISVLGGGGATDLFGGGGEGQGSGFVISEDGEILTNAHVVTDASATGAQTGPLHPAKEIYVQFADHNQVEARIVGFDPFADIALLQVDPEGLDLQPLPLGSENDVAVGEGVAAIGSPFGQEQSLSVGVVSATDRTIDSLTQFQIDGAIQTDASINPGNSGGPLLDAAGEVVGLNQQIRTSSGGNEGVGFAVPIDLAERAADQLRDDGSVSYAYLGVSTQPLYPQLADELGLDVDTGAIVSSVESNSPAADAGLQAGDEPIRFQGAQYKAGGDVIVAVDGHGIQANADLPRLISLLDPGDEISLDIIRDGDRQQVEVTLGERPDDVGP